MRLYYSPNSCALASHIILEEVGADYSLTLIDFAKNEQKEAPDAQSSVRNVVSERAH